LGYPIGEFSQIARVSIKTLRFYHECGILNPSFVDPDSGYRYYNEQCLERARAIMTLKEMDFSLQEIRELLAQNQKDEDIYRFLTVKAREVREKILRYREIERRIGLLIRLEEELKMAERNKAVVEKDLEDLLVAGIRFQGNYAEVGQKFSQLFKVCGRYIAGRPFSLYYDGEFKEENADIEACLSVRRPVKAGPVRSRLLEGGRAVAVLHRGPYESLGGSYKLALDYIHAKKLNLRLPSREVYLRGPGMLLRGSPKRYLTEILIPVEGERA
jgi:DNA-binding transcriptional MerR regulator